MSAQRRPVDLIEAGLVHHRAGRLAKAEAAYKKALAKNPKDAAALHLLGLAAADKGRFARALQLIAKALAVLPGQADFLHSAGHVLGLMERWDEAADHYRRALHHDPARPLTLSNLGNALKRLGRPDDAAESLARAVEIDPGFAEGWSNLGLAEKGRGDREAATAAFRQAVALRPNDAALRYNLANGLLEAGDHAAAAAEFRRVLAIAPSHAGARMNLAAALKLSGDLDGAIDELEAALATLPGDHPLGAELHWNLGLARLMRGDWARGWQEFEWRRAMPGYGTGGLELPAWDGGDAEGQTIVVNHEQGFGDAFQFMGFAGEVAARGARVIYRGPKGLLPIIGRMAGVAETVAFDDPLPDADAWAPMMSLPYLLALTDGAALARGRSLSADAARAAPYADRLGTREGLKIGICWQGNPDYKADADRSIPLRAFEPLARLPGVTLVALQKGPGSEQVADWPDDLPLIDLGPEIDAAGGAFMDSAAVIGALDLVVCSDTALAHLAGALGKETHLALNVVPDWRWGLEATDCVWYPSVTLHRQERPGDWPGVFRRIAATIEGRKTGHG